MKVLKLAFESEGEENQDLPPGEGEVVEVEPLEIGEGQTVEPEEFELVPEEVEEEDAEETERVETEGVVLESLYLYSTALESMIATKQYSEESLALVQFGIQQQLNRVNYKIEIPALESETDLGQQHQLVLEGLRDFINDICQNWVLNNKKQDDFWKNLFGSTKSILKRYEAELDRADSEFANKQDRLRQGKHRGSLGFLWDFFSTEDGPATKLPQQVVEDAAASEFILKKFSGDVIEVLKKLAAVINSAKVGSAQDVIKFAEEVQKLPHPVDLFDKKLIGGRPLFGAIGIEQKDGSARNSLTIGSDTFSKLGELATPKKLVEKGSFKHGLKKTFVGPAIAPHYEYTAEDVKKVTDGGRQYAEAIRAYLELEGELKKTIEGLNRAVEHLGKTAKDSEDSKAAKQVIGQVQQYATNLMDALKTPAKDELKRSLRGVQYTAYASLRMVFNAR